MVTEDQVIATLKQVFDPEIPVDVWNLGLIYNIKISDNGSFAKQNIGITMTFDPQWNVNMISEEARKKLNI